MTFRALKSCQISDKIHLRSTSKRRQSRVISIAIFHGAFFLIEIRILFFPTFRFSLINIFIEMGIPITKTEIFYLLVKKIKIGRGI